jgi:hypothetical protein
MQKKKWAIACVLLIVAGMIAYMEGSRWWQEREFHTLTLGQGVTESESPVPWYYDHDVTYRFPELL